MRIFGFEIKRAPSNLATPQSRAGWWPVIRESVAGAWQSNVEVTVSDVLSYPTAWSCILLIASYVAKCAIYVVKEDADGIWKRVNVAAFSPLLRKPNHYQNRIQFFFLWVISKLINGNTYVLKQRDNRNVVTAMYILDPCRVKPLVAPDGSVYYELKRDDLSEQPLEDVIVPASEIIHDIHVPLYHPLVGVSPIYACGVAAMQGLKLQDNSSMLSANGSNPGGVLTAPGAISQDTADRLKAYWDTNYTGDNVGKVAVLGDGLKFERMSLTAVDTEMIKQLNWSDEKICSTFLTPGYLVGVGPYPSYNNVEALTQQFYGQALQIIYESIELLLDEGTGAVEAGYGTEFDLDNLFRMDTATLMATIKEGVGAGVMKPNEGRFKLNLSPVEGGDTPYLQVQNYSLAALNKRDSGDPFAPVTPPVARMPVADAPPADDEVKDLSADAGEMFRKALGEAA